MPFNLPLFFLSSSSSSSSLFETLAQHLILSQSLYFISTLLSTFTPEPPPLDSTFNELESKQRSITIKPQPSCHTEHLSPRSPHTTLANRRPHLLSLLLLLLHRFHNQATAIFVIAIVSTFTTIPSPSPTRFLISHLPLCRGLPPFLA